MLSLAVHVVVQAAVAAVAAVAVVAVVAAVVAVVVGTVGTAELGTGTVEVVGTAVPLDQMQAAVPAVVTAVRY